MSTPFFNEKDNKIYYQHHDHSYAKNIIFEQAKSIILDSVNDDCLAEIFMYVPVCERPKIALVCQKWKRALDYSWGNVKKLQLTHWEQAENPNCLKTFTTPDEKLSFLSSLLPKLGRYLTQLDLTAYGYSNIVPVINEYCPILVELRLRFTYEDDILDIESYSRLSQLKVLAITFQPKDKRISANLIDSLLGVADTLTDLILSNWDKNVYIPCVIPKNLITVLRRLKALKRFEFGGLLIFRELEEWMIANHTCIKFHPYDRYLHKNIINLNQFKGITILDLLKFKASDHFLYTVANTIKQLTKLKVNCRWITNDGVVAISKMNNLTHLGFAGINDSIDSSSIKLLKNLIGLALPRSNKITDDVAMKVLENSPKMNKLFALTTSVEFIKKAAEISKNRKQLLSLVVFLKIDTKQYESQYLKISISSFFKKE